MTQDKEFILMNPSEFKTWIAAKQIARTVRTVQLHHTFLPGYAQFKGNNHFSMQRGMKNFHVFQNGWSDIGQHFSIFPDGTICTGRNLENAPTCIPNNNAGSICIECIGYFDIGKDTMTQLQKDAIVIAVAHLCKRFNLPIDDNSVVYHHWFYSDGRRLNGVKSYKSCPGTNFFGGNKPLHFNANLKPLLQKEIQTNGTGLLSNQIKKLAMVSADSSLKVRVGPDRTHTQINSLEFGVVVRVYEISANNWYRISDKHQEWISGNYTIDIKLGKITGDALRVRSGPDVTYDIVSSLKKGQEVHIYQTQNDWHQISFEDRWVKASYVEILI